MIDLHNLLVQVHIQQTLATPGERESVLWWRVQTGAAKMVRGQLGADRQHWCDPEWGCLWPLMWCYLQLSPDTWSLQAFYMRSSNITVTSVRGGNVTSEEQQHDIYKHKPSKNRPNISGQYHNWIPFNTPGGWKKEEGLRWLKYCGILELFFVSFCLCKCVLLLWLKFLSWVCPLYKRGTWW